MSCVKITWPKEGAPSPSVNGMLVASGWADMSIIGVAGTCTPRSKSHPGSTRQGVLHSFVLSIDAEGNRIYRWAIAFDGLSPCEYELKVVGPSESGPVATDEIEFGSSSHKKLFRTIYPTPNESIPADGFQPWGDMTEGLVTNAVMNETSVTPTQEIEYQTLTTDTIANTWSALFPHLENGTYDLVVTYTPPESSPFTETVPGLTVSG
jgi:hypothetical protein